MKHTYKLQCAATGGTWWTMFEGQLGYLQGYLDARRDDMPRIAHRIIRSDGKLIDDLPSCEDVGIGLIAGSPTAEQYRYAAERAMKKAEQIESLARQQSIRDLIEVLRDTMRPTK